MAKMGYELDVRFFKPFVDGTIETLKIQCGLEAKVGKPFLRGKGTSPEMDIAIAGVIGITSKAFKGSISLCFPEKTFLAVLGGMLGEKYDRITKDVEDGAGELTNIIFGAAKRVLNDQGHTIEKALPSVIVGGNVRIRPITPVPTMILPFLTAAGEFQIEIGIEPL